MKFPPIDAPDGIYQRVGPWVGLPHIGVRCVEAVNMAHALGCRVWLVFNGTSVFADPGDTSVAVQQRWMSHREAFQSEQAGRDALAREDASK